MMQYLYSIHTLQNTMTCCLWMFSCTPFVDRFGDIDEENKAFCLLEGLIIDCMDNQVRDHPVIAADS